MSEIKISTARNNTVIIIMHKKRNIADSKNYRPINLLSHLCKLFTKILIKHFKSELNFYQPIGQTYFRAGYGTCDHLQVVKTLIEKSIEYNKSFVLIFVDHEKAFDSIKHNQLIQNANRESDRPQILCYTTAHRRRTAIVRIYKKKINLK